MRRDRFCFAGSLEHEELGQDGYGFKPDGKGPKHLDWRERVALVVRYCFWRDGMKGGPGGRDVVGGWVVGSAYLCGCVGVWKQESENGASAN